jgi:hypothetical protein
MSENNDLGSAAGAGSFDARQTDSVASTLCEGCPRICYPDVPTRCLPCPRRPENLKNADLVRMSEKTLKRYWIRCTAEFSDGGTYTAQREVTKEELDFTYGRPQRHIIVREFGVVMDMLDAGLSKR